MTNSLWWYVARAGGLVSWGLLAAAVLWGLALRSRLLGSRPRPAWLLDLHRYLAGVAVIFVGVHVGAILLDGYVHFDVVQVLIPFTSTWHPGAVAWGIVAGYLLLAVELTSLARARISRTLWRRVHYLSFPLFVFATVHALTAGTDRGTSAFQLGVWSVCALVAVLTALRARPAAPARSASAARPSAPRPGAGPVVPAGRPPAASRPAATGRPVTAPRPAAPRAPVATRAVVPPPRRRVPVQPSA